MPRSAVSLERGVIDFKSGRSFESGSAVFFQSEMEVGESRKEQNPVTSAVYQGTKPSQRRFARTEENEVHSFERLPFL
jgi:hypothetical protein